VNVLFTNSQESLNHQKLIKQPFGSKVISLNQNRLVSLFIFFWFKKVNKIFYQSKKKKKFKTLGSTKFAIEKKRTEILNKVFSIKNRKKVKRIKRNPLKWYLFYKKEINKKQKQLLLKSKKKTLANMVQYKKRWFSIERQYKKKMV